MRRDEGICRPQAMVKTRCINLVKSIRGVAASAIALSIHLRRHPWSVERSVVHVHMAGRTLRRSTVERSRLMWRRLARIQGTRTLINSPVTIRASHCLMRAGQWKTSSGVFFNRKFRSPEGLFAVAVAAILIMVDGRVELSLMRIRVAGPT
jgi:hypothetical protein